MAATILLVEDSRTIASMLSMVLRQNGFEVLNASDGLDGLFKLSGQNVDLIISDINMPRMDGLTFIRKVRENPDYSKVPVVVLSTEASDTDRARGMGVGADLYLTKPIAPTELVKEVRAVLDRPARTP